MTEVGRWSIRLARPTLVLDVAAGQDVALAHMIGALRARGFRVHATPEPTRVNAVRRNWWLLLIVEVPERWFVDVSVTPGGTGTLVRCSFIKGTSDGGFARRAPLVLNDAVTALRAQGVGVAVGGWTSGLPAR